MDTAPNLAIALQAAGALLARRGEQAAIVVVGGTALNLLGVITRATQDVDVIAAGTPSGTAPPSEIRAPDPLPDVLMRAVVTVARDLGLPDDWLNTTVARQWVTGLPPGFAARVTWRQYGGLWVGLAGRRDLIFLKLYAAADDVGPTSRHFKDLLALKPTADDLEAARRWIALQDASPEMHNVVDQVIAHVRQASR